MSDPNTPPPSYDPQASIPLGYGVTTATPTAVMVIGVIAILFGASGLLCAPFQFLSAFGTMTTTTVTTAGAATTTTTATTTSAGIMAGSASPMMTAWSIIGGLLGVLLAGMELAGGIGSVMLKPWARRLLLAYAYAAIGIG